MREASPEQIRNCKAMGWQYEGEGVFTKVDYIGWFENKYFFKDTIG